MEREHMRGSGIGTPQEMAIEMGHTLSLHITAVIRTILR